MFRAHVNELVQLCATINDVGLNKHANFTFTCVNVIDPRYKPVVELETETIFAVSFAPSRALPPPLQTVSDRGEMLIGLGMIAGGAMLGAIAVVSSVVARLHRKVLAEELQDVERLHPPADHDGKENPEAWSALESGNPYASVVSEPASEVRPPTAQG